MLFPGYKKPFRIIFGFLVFLALIFVLAISLFLVRYSATSEKVCGSCHPELIEPWKNSQGHPSQQTTCYKCHSSPAVIVPQSLNIVQHARDQLVPPQYIADDELTSKRCLDCHQNVLELGYKVKKKILNFNHRFHSQEGLECIDCHRRAGHEYMAGGTNRPSVSECLDCHLREFEGPPKSQKCLSCHEVMLAPARETETVPILKPKPNEKR